MEHLSIFWEAGQEKGHADAYSTIEAAKAAYVAENGNIDNPDEEIGINVYEWQENRWYEVTDFTSGTDTTWEYLDTVDDWFQEDWIRDLTEAPYKGTAYAEGYGRGYLRQAAEERRLRRATEEVRTVYERDNIEACHE